MWVLSLQKAGSGGVGTNLSASAISVNSGASDSTWHFPTTAAISALTGATFGVFRFLWTKTGTPGTLTADVSVGYRLVLT